MKKLISVLLAVLMMTSLFVPSFATDEKAKVSLTGSQIPVILICGDGEPLYNTEGEKVFHFSEILSMLGDTEEGSVGDGIRNVLSEFLVDGLLYNQWDGYYNALEKEIGDLFEEVRLDENGNNPNGVDVSKSVREKMENSVKVDAGKSKGYYGLADYQFFYDWRLDPYEIADLFHEHIEKVKTITGKDKVSIVIRCLGSSVVFAYIEKYGLDSIHGISMNATVSNGAEIISETISGKFKIDANAINRFITDMNYLELADIDNFVVSSIDLLEKSGVIDAVTETMKIDLYGKLVQGVTSALSLSTFFTWPSYWSCVAKEDYKEAIYHVFGEEGSEKRIQYKGLIEKIENYHNKVGSKVNELAQRIKDEGKNLCIISKYGFQIAPICESRNEIGDQFVTVKRSSFGATTGTVYNTLTEEYIESRKIAGFEKYISPDKLVDASTCQFPDYTWFTKGSSHSVWNDFENGLMYTVATSNKQLTVDDFEYTQFVYRNNKTGEAAPLTEENCNTESWKAYESYDEPKTIFGKIMAFLVSLMNWMRNLLFGNLK